MDREEHESRLRRLPPRIAVGLAARCGRRVQAIATAFWKQSGDENASQHIDAIDLALRAAEEYGCGRAADVRAAYAAYAYAAADAAYAADARAANANAARAAAAAAARAAAAAANAAANAANAADANANAADAARAAAAANANAYLLTADLLTADLLTAEQLTGKKLVPEAEKTLDPSPDGPLGAYWPDGEPEWLTEYVRKMKAGEFRDGPQAKQAERPSQDPEIVFVWDPDVLSTEQYKELFATMGDLVRAAGGEGLRVLDSQNFGAVTEGVRQS